METYKKLIVVILICLFTGISVAEIINIPDDHETIQAGIDASEDGDTVLVQPGEYVENIDFNGHNIMLASLFIMEGDEDFIDRTIIDGNENGSSVVALTEGEDATTKLIGFTIQNGSTDYGGGIYIRNSNPTLSHLIVKDNIASSAGGGIYLTSGSSPAISQCTIIENYCNRYGGGLACHDESQPIITNSNIVKNESNSTGGGIQLGEDSSSQFSKCLISANISHFGGGISGRGSGVFVNCDIVDNSAATAGSGIHMEREGLILLNSCIIWSNGIESGGGRHQIHHSDVQNGEDGIDVGNGNLDWGEGNIDDNPLFADRRRGDYSLTENSPCINTGDPNLNPDPDGTRADMGAYYYRLRGVLDGFVLDAQNNQSLDSAFVSILNGPFVFTDADGYWIIEHAPAEEFSLTASMPEYLDSLLNNLEVGRNDTLSIIFQLLHSELEPSIEDITTELEVGASEQFEIIISNPGNGVLDWSAESRYREEVRFEPWELRQSLQLGQELDDSGIYGVVYIDSLYYVAGANDREPVIYILNTDGDLIDSFAQPGEHNRGMKDITFDGELIWGAVGNTIYGITLEGEIAISFDAPYHPSSAITWDYDREVMWISGTTTDPVGLDRDGNLVEGMEIDREGLYLYGFAYFADDSDGAPLYLFTKERETNRPTVYKHNFETNQNIFVTHLEHEAGGTPQGAFITRQYDDYSWNFISVVNNAQDDRADIWQLDANIGWALLDTSAGRVNPAEEQDVTFIIDATDLVPVEYPAELIFSHNGFGLETVIPIDLTVTALGIIDREEDLIPMKFEITSAYPNPFNSLVRLNYTIPQSAEVSIKLFDIKGSLVDEVTDSAHQIGQHTAIWNASAMPSGLYFARMEGGYFSQTVKLMLMK